MKNFKIKFALALTMLIALSACKKENIMQAVVDDEGITSIAGTWKVVSYDDWTNNTQITKDENNTWTDFNKGDVTISFQDSKQMGDINGKTVTNTIFGNYTLSNPRKMKVESLGGTRINQPDWADLFWEHFPKAEAYAVNNKQLRIFYNSNKNSISFERIPDTNK
jgi:heat shock protein HslJ